ncbi:MAG TPA: bacteriohemerythrin [Bryobacteraceae bacterium]|nr:bacteriohemerythrin [Bryobacteraceae bacterium]
MSFFVAWDERYSVGVWFIDRQHRFLISLIRQLQEAMVGGCAREMLSPLFRKLVTYTHYHFASEESFFRERGYAGIERHREQHRGMARQIIEMQEAVSCGKLRMGAPVHAFLRNWLVEHVLGDDQAAFREIEAAGNAAIGSGGGAGADEVLPVGQR